MPQALEVCRGSNSLQRRLGRSALVLLLMMGLAELPALAAQGRFELVSRVSRRVAPDTAGGFDARTSSNGRYVAFTSSAPNLIPGQVDRAGSPDVFLHDRVTGTTVLVSHAAGSPAATSNQYAVLEAISADGNWIVFSSASSDLVEGLGSDPLPTQLYLFERATGEVTLVSRRTGDGKPANEGSGGFTTLSADGSRVAFQSRATDLTAAPLDPNVNIFLFERATGGTVTLVSHSASSPSQAGNGESFNPVLSADGRFVAYFSRSQDLVTGQFDPAPFLDVFLFDSLTGTNTLVTHSSASALTVGNAGADFSSIGLSADGRFLVYASSAKDLVAGVTDTNARPDVFLYDRLTNTNSLVGRSADSPNVPRLLGSRRPAISADGSTVAFFEATRNLLQSQVFVFDRLNGMSTLVTRSASSPSSPANSGTVGLDLSDDGRYVLFSSLATDLVPGQVDLPGTRDVFLHDRAAGSTVLVSHAAGSSTRAGDDQASHRPDLSGDGSWAVYDSAAGDLDATKRDSNQTFDAFLYGRTTATSQVISLHTPGAGSRSANNASLRPAISGDGRFVVYLSLATNLVPGQIERNTGLDVYLYDRVARKTILVSRSASSPRITGNGISESALISRDGSTVLFTSTATDLVAGQHGPTGNTHVFLFNRVTGNTVLVSRSSASPKRMANGLSFPGGLSADGSIAAFSSFATDLIAGQKDRNQSADVFLYDLRTATVTLASHITRSPLQTGEEASWFTSMSLDGDWIGFTSSALNLTPGVPPHPGPHGGSYANAYLFQRQTGAVTLLSKVQGPDGPLFGGRNPILSADARYVAYVGDGIRFLDRSTGKLHGRGSRS